MANIIDNMIKAFDLNGADYIVFKVQNDILSIPYFSASVPLYYGYSFEDFKEKTYHNIVAFASDYDSMLCVKYLHVLDDTANETYISIQVKDAHGNLTILEGKCSFLLSLDAVKYYFCKPLFVEKETKKEEKVVTEEISSNISSYKTAVDFAGVSLWDYDLLNNRIEPIQDSFIPGDNLFDDYPYSFSKAGILSSKDFEKLLENIELVKKGNSVEYEFWYHIPYEKQPRFIKTKYVVERNAENVPYIAHGMSIDLTEAKNAEINFEHRTNAVLRNDPDSIATFHLNLSNNTLTISSILNSYLLQIGKLSSVDELITSCTAIISDKNEQLNFINAFSRASLLAQFNSGSLQVKLEHHMVMKGNNDQWVNTVVDIVKNPITNDVEAVMHISNIHYRKIIDSMVNGTVIREYEFIALAYIKKNSFVLIDKYNYGVSKEKPGFIEHFKKLFTELIMSKEELENVLNEFTLENLIEKINLYGEYIIQFNSSDDPQINHHRVLRFSFLNKRKDIINISCIDNTKLYNESQEQKKKLFDALEIAEKANQAKSEFLSLVSHDIRTPLNGIIGMTQLAMKENNPEKIKQYLSKAETSSKFLLGLINDLLDMSKIESGKIELHNEIYSYKEFIDYINSIIRPLCQKKNQHFTIHYENLIPYIYIDKLRLNQIIFNLLSNSCKYTEENGSIQLKIINEKLDSSNCITTFIIKDNGIGMSEEFQQHLFETFSQENRISFNSNEGTGLGLSITRNLIELMGGEITVDSVLDKGTTFTVKLPCPYFEENDESLIDLSLLSSSIKPKKKDKIKLDYTGKRFLLCEDNIINQEIAIEILENLNASVDVADDGETGVKMFGDKGEGYYDAIFMDIRMPKMDGLVASKEIRSINTDYALNIPIIAMTGNAMSEDRMECIEAGMNAYVAKPIIINELYKIMSEVIK